MRETIQLATIDISNGHTKLGRSRDDLFDTLCVCAVPDQDDLELSLPRPKRREDGLSALKVRHRARMLTDDDAAPKCVGSEERIERQG